MFVLAFTSALSVCPAAFADEQMQSSSDAEAPQQEDQFPAPGATGGSNQHEQFQTSENSLGLTQDEQAFLKSADEKWSKMISDGQSMLDGGRETPATSMFKRALTQVQKLDADQRAKDRMTAISCKKLGTCYLKKADYIKADELLKEAKASYDKLLLKDGELDLAFKDLGTHYCTIEPNSLGESVTKQLKEAGVNKIAVFKQPDRALVEINLEQKYIKPIDSKDVPKISFNKKVSFEFLNRVNGDYQVSKIQGLQVLAKNLWVNLLESLVKVGDKPVAEVTAGKMGVTKTVTVDIPKDMFDSTKQLLDNLIASVKGQPAYAAQTAGPAATTDATEPAAATASSSEPETTTGSSTEITKPLPGNDTTKPADMERSTDSETTGASSSTQTRGPANPASPEFTEPAAPQTPAQ